MGIKMSNTNTEERFARELVERIAVAIPGIYIEYRIEYPQEPSSFSNLAAPFSLLIIELCLPNTDPKARSKRREEWVEEIAGRGLPIVFKIVGVSIPLYPGEMQDPEKWARYRAHHLHEIIWGWVKLRLEQVRLTP